MGRVKYTDAEIELLREHYPNNLSSDIIDMFPGRSIAGLMNKSRSCGIKKSAAFFKSEKSGRTIGQHSESGRFKKGSGAWNKGKRLVDYLQPDTLKKIARHEFKKGNKPHNWKPIGSERVTPDGYIEVKVRDLSGNKNYELRHRLIYEQNFGEIPVDHVVIFKDNDARNFEPDNLEAISKRANLNRNFESDKTIVKRFLGVKDPEMVAEIIKKAPELVELKRKTMQLNQKIKKQDGNKNK